MSGVDFWINNPDFRLVKPEDPNNPEWCAVAQPFVEWGDNLLARLAQDPAPLKVGYAKWKLLDRYMRLYHRTTDEHRPEANQGAHPCLHAALLLMWQRLEDVETQAAIPELEPPQVAGSEPEFSEEEITGVIIGTADTDASDQDKR